MSWEDEDFDVPVAATADLDFEEDDEGLMGDWEAAAESSDEDKPKKGAAPKPKLSHADRIAQRKRKEQDERERKALEKNEHLSKADQQRAQEESDLVNASDLLAAADVHPRARAAQSAKPAPKQEGPAKLSDLAIFQATSAKDYTDLRKTLAPVVNDLAEKNKANLHSNFIIELCRDMCKPLTSDQVHKVISTLNAIANDKYREERARRLGARAKPNVKVAASKPASKPQPVVPETLEDDGLDDDDFM